MTNKNSNDNVESEKEKAVEKETVKNAPKADTQQAKTESKTPKQDQKEKPDSKPTQPEPAKFEEKQGKRGVRLGAVAIVLSIIFGGGLTYLIQQKDASYQAQIDELKSQLQQSQAQLRQDVSASSQSAVAKANEVANDTEVALAQQKADIKGLQVAIADVKGRRPNDWLLAESDYLVKMAGRKLFLEHDAVSATQLMESADQRIAALNDPSLTPLRQALANDITKLRNIPIIDRDGLVLRLTALQQQVDTLPLANAILPEAKVEAPEVVSQDINDWQSNLKTSLKDFSENFITFRTRDGNVIPLLSPEQHFYLRENIKAQLSTAIKAVYGEKQELYGLALTTADKWSKSFFNQDDNSVKEFSNTLALLNKQNIQVEYPVKFETQQILSEVISERLRREVTTLITEEK